MSRYSVVACINCIDVQPKGLKLATLKSELRGGGGGGGGINHQYSQ